MMPRAAALALAASLLIAVIPPGRPAETPRRANTPNPVDRAIARGLAYLGDRQEGDGAFFDREEGSRDRHETALTSLAILAYCAAGHLPSDRTREGAILKRAIDFVLRPDRQEPDGFLGQRDSSRMYGHGMATLALTELLGMGADKAQDRLIRERAARGLELILRSQRQTKREPKFNGGWRYTPDSSDSDLSITVWQLMALRSARNAGLEVPKEAIDLAVAYLKRSYQEEQERRTGGPVGGCAYQPGGRPEFAMVASGLLALCVCGEYTSPEVQGSANWLRVNRPSPGHRWFYYGMYYYAQGMYQRGGEYAEEARRTTEELLLPLQNEDGSWLGAEGQEHIVGKIYGTALAILSLAVKYHYLPIYQR
jgi:hypothetical protein